MVIPAADIQEAFDQLSQTQKSREQPTLEVVESVRNAVPNINNPDVKKIPETEKTLRGARQWHLQGKLTYSAESLPSETVRVKIKIMLPLSECPDSKESVEHPKEEHELTLELPSENLNSLESLGSLLRTKIIDFIFKNFSKNNGLEDYDIGRINEMVEDIFDTFCKKS